MRTTRIRKMAAVATALRRECASRRTLFLCARRPPFPVCLNISAGGIITIGHFHAVWKARAGAEITENRRAEEWNYTKYTIFCIPVARKGKQNGQK